MPADGRQWEMVSPPTKSGALIREAAGQALLQAAAGGDAMTYQAVTPTEAGPAGNAFTVQVLSTRGISSWESKDISTPHAAPTGPSVGAGGEYRFFSEDLSVALVHPLGPFTPCGAEQPCVSPAASEQTVFARSDFTTASPPAPCAGGCYRPLVTGCPLAGPCSPSIQEDADVPPGTRFGEATECESTIAKPEKATFCGPEFAGASPDGSHVVIHSPTALTSTPAPQGGLYEWSEGAPPAQQLRLISVLPGQEGGQAAPNAVLGNQDTIVRHAVSDDGSRVIWEGIVGGVHGLYMRYNATQAQSALGEHGECTEPANACTVRLDLPQGGSGSGKQNQHFQTASSDGSRVFFTDEQQLTEDSGAIEGQADLYECEMRQSAGPLTCALKDLTPLSAGRPAGVLRTIVGASEDGSWVYFVADGALTAKPNAGGEHAVVGDCAEIPTPACGANLYVIHGGEAALVAVLSGADSPDWADGTIPSLGLLAARVSPDGHWLAFMSQRSLTGHDNRDAVSAVPDEEAFLYNGESGHTVCVSCRPSGARPVGQEYGPEGLNMPLVGGERVWNKTSWLAADLPGWTEYTLSTARHQPSYLSNSGRMFFNSHDALVPQDDNGTWDVYEYEPPGVPEGQHACTSSSATFTPSSGGCVSLISSGASSKESAFLDASETGGDVFFLTNAQLVPQDYDTLRDVYDAHECTSSSPCLPVAGVSPPPCETESSCKASPAPQPSIFGAPSSATFSGPGNLMPPTKPAVKPLTRAQKLAKALTTCKRKYRHRESKRRACERAAHKRYAAVKAGRTTSTKLRAK